MRGGYRAAAIRKRFALKRILYILYIFRMPNTGTQGVRIGLVSKIQKFGLNFYFRLRRVPEKWKSVRLSCCWKLRSKQY